MLWLVLADQRPRAAALVAYLEALAQARTSSTPATWESLLAASRALQATQRTAPPPPSALALALAPVPLPPSPPASLATASASLELGARARVCRAELQAECERSRMLMATSRRLIEESREICSAIASFLVLPPAGSTPAPAGAPRRRRPPARR